MSCSKGIQFGAIGAEVDFEIVEVREVNGVDVETPMDLSFFDAGADTIELLLRARKSGPAIRRVGLTVQSNGTGGADAVIRYTTVAADWDIAATEPFVEDVTYDVQAVITDTSAGEVFPTDLGKLKIKPSITYTAPP
ncbi:MAG: hypothetical protein AAF447_08450 [Myxococcota bacterium]